MLSPSSGRGELVSASAALASAANDSVCAPAAGGAGFGRNIITMWHCGQRTLNDVLPRSTARGIRIAAWHLLQTTRIESAGGGATAGFAAAAGVAAAAAGGRAPACPEAAGGVADFALPGVGRAAAGTALGFRTVPTPSPAAVCVGAGASCLRTGWMLALQRISSASRAAWPSSRSRRVVYIDDEVVISE